jgi:hypothetical protein
VAVSRSRCTRGSLHNKPSGKEFPAIQLIFEMLEIAPAHYAAEATAKAVIRRYYRSYYACILPQALSTKNSSGTMHRLDRSLSGRPRRHTIK